MLKIGHMLFKFRILLFSLLFASSLLKAEDAWHMLVDKKGVKVYQKQAFNYKYKHTKGVIKLHTNLARFHSLLSDFEACDEWVFGCITAIKRSDGRVEMTFAGPLFTKNREVVLETQVNQEGHNRWSIDVFKVAAEKAHDDYVQIRQFEAKWLLTQLSKSELLVEHQFYIDPNVAIEIGVNNYNKKAVYKTLLNLQEIISKPKYQSAQLPDDFLLEASE